MAGASVITRRDHCILVSGNLSPEMLMALTEEAPDGAVLCPDVARLAGVGWTIGLPADLAALRATLAAEAPRPNIPGLSAGAAEWLVCGHQGSSSATLFFKVTGVLPGILRDENDPSSHPCDPSDLNRCLLLIDAAPEIRAGLDVMRDVSPEWAALTEHWDELAALFIEEAGPNWSKSTSAPQTDARLRALLDRARGGPSA